VKLPAVENPGLAGLVPLKPSAVSPGFPPA